MSHRSVIIRLLRDNSAASAIEYGLILALISMGVIVAAQGLMVSLGSVLGTVTTTLTSAVSSSSG